MIPCPSHSRGRVVKREPQPAIGMPPAVHIIALMTQGPGITIRHVRRALSPRVSYGIRNQSRQSQQTVMFSRIAGFNAAQSYSSMRITAASFQRFSRKAWRASGEMLCPARKQRETYVPFGPIPAASFGRGVIINSKPAEDYLLQRFTDPLQPWAPLIEASFDPIERGWFPPIPR